MRLVSARNFTVICHYWMILCTIQAIVPWNTMPATLNKSIFKTRSHVLFGLGTISHSRSLLQYLFLLYYESLEEAGCRIVAEKLLLMTTQRNLFSFILKLLPQIRVHTSVFRILRSAKKQYEMNLIHKQSQELYKI